VRDEYLGQIDVDIFAPLQIGVLSVKEDSVNLFIRRAHVEGFMFT